MLSAEGQHFICPLNVGYILYQGVILAFRGLILPGKTVLQDMIYCPFAVNKCPFKRPYYSIFGRECLVFGNFICCPFRMYCLDPYTVPLGPNNQLAHTCAILKKWQNEILHFFLKPNIYFSLKKDIFIIYQILTKNTSFPKQK